MPRKRNEREGPADAAERSAPPIRFYSVNDDYGELSNFARFPITLKGKRWPTSEHYFQAQKFADAKAKLIEHTENDDFWGDGGDGHGRNELGRILMAVRDRLRGEAE